MIFIYTLTFLVLVLSGSVQAFPSNNTAWQGHSGGPNESYGDDSQWPHDNDSPWDHDGDGSDWVLTRTKGWQQPEGTMGYNTGTNADMHPGATSFSSERSPQCTESSISWDKEFLTETLTASAMINYFAQNPFLSQNFPLRTKLVTYMGNPTTMNPNNCCGTCSIHRNEVTMHYWPSPDSNTECLANIASDGHNLDSQIGLFRTTDSRSAVNAGTGLPAYPQVVRRTVHAPIITPGPRLLRDSDSGPITVVTNGHTFISPSIYLEIPTVLARDPCGPFGQKYTNVLWFYQPVDISSVVPVTASCWPYLLGMDSLNSACKTQTSTKSFDFADLPCPGDDTRKSGEYTFIYNTKAEYQPLLMQPWRMHNIDPD
ncbi:MAG: hypothetical protein MMC23_008737 [Stictis urceolatum]|nr:hypothetical protein [Stictis urceolata]